MVSVGVLLVRAGVFLASEPVCLCSMGEPAERSERDELLKEFSALFLAPSNGVKLPKVLVGSLSIYFVDELKLVEVDEVARNNPNEMEEAASEAWTARYSEALPKPHVLRIRTWAGESSSKGSGKAETLVGLTTSVGDIAEDDRRVAAKEEAKDLDLSPFEREKAVKDMAMQGLTCERIVALSQSLILGKVVKPSHTVGMKYGEDPALSEKSKQMRKAGKRMLNDVIKGKNYAEAGSFFSDLMMSYSADGMITESSLVASWWAETSGCFSGEKEMIFEYLQSYFEKYAGRGLPERVDTVLVTRVRNQSASAGGASKEEVKQLKSKIADLEEKNSKMSSNMNSLKQAVENLTKKKPTVDEQAERRAKVRGHFCKELGHYESECPKKQDKDKTDG